MKIIVEKRSTDWKAYLEGHPEIWGCGANRISAIGDLITSHQKTFNVEVV